MSRGLKWLTCLALVLGAVALWPVARIVPHVDDAETAPVVREATLLASATRAQPVLTPKRAPVPVAREPEHLQQSHPITPEREALQQELRLVGALQDALDLEDVLALRSLVERYRAHVPDDVNKLGEGYALLADCLDVSHDRTAARAAAAAYYQKERASTLRRYIRRVCLER
jgi:hypothetical protein